MNAFVVQVVFRRLIVFWAEPLYDLMFKMDWMPWDFPDVQFIFVLVNFTVPYFNLNLYKKLNAVDWYSCRCDK